MSRLVSSLLVLSVTSALQGADNPEVMLEVGDPAPSFSAVTDEGKTFDSKDVVGKKFLVVYFYPADMTGGCTKQACAFRDHKQDLADAGAVVVGVSGDSAQNHALFRKAHQLNFPLLADEDGKVAAAFGVPLRDGGAIQRTIDGVERTLTRGVTASRWTFVIGLDGRILHKDTSVKAAVDSESVLKAIRQSTASSE